MRPSACGWGGGGNGLLEWQLLTHTLCLHVRLLVSVRENKKIALPPPLMAAHLQKVDDGDVVLVADGM